MTSCPYLGLQDDPGLHFDIPTSANYCHKAAPIESVKPSYQEEVCLSEEYRLCWVLHRSWNGAFPPEAKGGRVGKIKRANYLWIGLIIVVIVGLGTNYIMGKPNMFSGISDHGKAEESLPTQVTSIAAADTALETTAPSTDTIPPAQTPTLEESQLLAVTSTDLNTMTPPLTSSATAISTTAITPLREDQASTPGPKFQTPFGPQDAYVLHNIAEGESLPLISNLYNTDIDMILALNAWVAELGVQPNRVIILMPGQTDSLDVEPLSVDFTQEENTVSEFAASQDVSTEEVRFFNDLGVGEIIPAGRWLIFPYRSETLTPSPTAIPTPDLSKALTELFGPHDEYILHKITIGESLPLLEKRYLTSADVIRTANVILGSLQIGQVLVIIPGQKEAIDTPRFSVINVDETVSIEKLASDLGVLYADILYYNNLKQGGRYPSGPLDNVSDY